MLNGRPITSSAGAMGLMQVMPGTYSDLRNRYALGGDVTMPRDNILAGTAYLRQMYERSAIRLCSPPITLGRGASMPIFAGQAASQRDYGSYVESIVPGVGTALVGTRGGTANPKSPRVGFVQGGVLKSVPPTALFFTHWQRETSAATLVVTSVEVVKSRGRIHSRSCVEFQQMKHRFAGPHSSSRCLPICNSPSVGVRRGA